MPVLKAEQLSLNPSSTRLYEDRIAQWCAIMSMCQYSLQTPDKREILGEEYWIRVDVTCCKFTCGLLDLSWLPQFAGNAAVHTTKRLRLAFVDCEQSGKNPSRYSVMVGN